MASQQSTVDRILLAIAGAGNVAAKKMFGEYCVYLDEKPIGLICDDRLYFKPTDAGRELVPDCREESPYPGAKPHTVIPPESWEGGAAMARLARATFDGLPKAKKRKG